MNKGELHLGVYQSDNLVLYLKNIGNSPVKILEINQVGQHIKNGELPNTNDKSILFHGLKGSKLCTNERFKYEIISQSSFHSKIIAKDISKFRLFVSYVDFMGKENKEILEVNLTRGESGLSTL